MPKSRIKPIYKRPTEAEFKKLWKNADFAFDANVLLHIYRYDDNSRNNLIESLTKLKDRLFIPEQAYFEFHENRFEVINDQFQPLLSFEKILKSRAEELTKLLTKGHSYVDQKTLAGLIKEVEALIQTLSKFNQDSVDAKEDDKRYESLTAVIRDKVGSAYDDDKLDAIRNEFTDRAKDKIPPGYKDVAKNKGQEFGDLVLWFQLIDRANEAKKSMIFVTDDRKEDWWLIDEGHRLGPRPELVTEFNEKAHQLIHFYTTERFLFYAEEYLKVQVAPETLQEAKNVEDRLEKASGIRDYFLSIGATAEAVSALSKNYPPDIFPSFYENMKDTQSLFGSKLNALIAPIGINTALYADIIRNESLMEATRESFKISEAVLDAARESLKIRDAVTDSAINAARIAEPVIKGAIAASRIAEPVIKGAIDAIKPLRGGIRPSDILPPQRSALNQSLAGSAQHVTAKRVSGLEDKKNTSKS